MWLKKRGLLIICAAVVTFVICFSFSYHIAFIDVFKTAESTVFFLVSMLLCFCLCLLIWFSVFKFCDALKSKSPKAKRFLVFSGIFFAVMTFFYFLTFPGFWNGDAFSTLVYSRNFILYGWHHVFTQFIYIFSLFFFIHPTLIVLFQIILIALIVGYLLTDISFVLEQKWGITSKWIYLFLVPLFLPPTIIHVLIPLRLTLYAFLEILVFYEIIMLKIRKQPLSTLKVAVLGTVIAILAFWRSETIIYIALLPLILFLFSKKLFTRRLVCIFFGCLIPMSLLMYVPQKISMQKSNIDLSVFTETQFPDAVITRNGQPITSFEIAYQVSGIMKTFIFLAKAEYHKNGSLKPEIYNYVYDFDRVVEENLTGTYCYWEGLIRLDLTKKEFSEMRSLYIKLIFSNFGEFCKERSGVFAMTNGLWTSRRVVINEPWIKPTDYGYDVMEYAFMPKMRQFTIKLLLMGNKGEQFFLYHIFYNALPQIIALIVVLIWAVKNFKKSHFFKVLTISVAILMLRICLLVVTSPDMYFMYYYWVYLMGNFIIVAFIVNKIHKKKNAALQGSESLNKTE